MKVRIGDVEFSDVTVAEAVELAERLAKTPGVDPPSSFFRKPLTGKKITKLGPMATGVLLACRDQPVSAAELCRRFKVKSSGKSGASNVRVCLARLVKLKKLRRVSRGMYVAAGA